MIPNQIDGESGLLSYRGLRLGPPQLRDTGGFPQGSRVGLSHG
jgi:hypothetical protein